MDVAKVYNPATKAMEPAVTHKVEFSPLTRQTVGMVRLHERTIYELEDDDEVRHSDVCFFALMIGMAQFYSVSCA